MIIIFLKLWKDAKKKSEKQSEQYPPKYKNTENTKTHMKSGEQWTISGIYGSLRQLRQINCAKELSEKYFLGSLGNFALLNMEEFEVSAGANYAYMYWELIRW